MVREIVEQFLDADRVRGRKLVQLQQVAPDVGIAGRIDVDRERRERLFDGPHEGILLNPVERLGVAGKLFGHERINLAAGNRSWSGLLHWLSLAVLAVCCWGGRSGRSDLLSRLVLDVLAECRYGGPSRRGRSRSLRGRRIRDSAGRRRSRRRRVLCNLELLPISIGRRTGVATLHLAREVLLSIRARGGRIETPDHRRRFSEGFGWRLRGGAGPGFGERRQGVEHVARLATGLVGVPGEQTNRSTHQQRGRHRHESVRPAPPGAAVRGEDRGLECLVDQPVVIHRQGRYGLRLFLQLFGKPLCGLANLGDVIAGLLAVGQELLDLGSLGGVNLAQGVCGQPGVVGIEDHLWFSFGGFRHGLRPAGRRKVVREAS